LPNLSSFPDLISPSSQKEVGLILTERLINMPTEIVPPMYNMLMEEVEWANHDDEPYTFSHYLILSKTYKEVESKLDAEEARSSKKMKKDKSVADNTFYFHPEDEILHKYALGYGNFDYTSESDEGRADSKRAFQEMGIVPQGHMILIERSRFEEAVKAVTGYLQSQG
jgi:protein BCP1